MNEESVKDSRKKKTERNKGDLKEKSKKRRKVKEK